MNPMVPPSSPLTVSELRFELQGRTEVLSANVQLHYRVKAKRVKYLRFLGNEAARTLLRKTKAPHGRCSVLITIYPPTRRRWDPSNLSPTVKALMDGFTDAGLWPDDDSRHIPLVTFAAGEGLSGEAGQWRLDFLIEEL